MIQTILYKACKQCNRSITKGDIKRRLYCSKSCKSAAEGTRRGKVVLGLPPSTVGALSELRIATDLLTKGYYVYRSVSPNGPCDLIAMHGNIIIRIEVSTALIKTDGKFSSSNKDASYIYDVRALISQDGNRIEYKPDIPDISRTDSKALPDLSEGQEAPPTPPPTV